MPYLLVTGGGLHNNWDMERSLREKEMELIPMPLFTREMPRRACRRRA